MNEYKPIILLNKHQIFSMELWSPGRSKDIFSSFIIDSLLSRLESFVVKWIDSDVVIPLLINLAFLPRLVSLTIDTQNTGANLSDIYRLIFALPTLKYNNFSTNNWENQISLPMATNQQKSTIETLVIDHSCTFNELASLTSYTPQLRRLRLCYITGTDSNIRTITPMILSNLSCISINPYQKTFDELETIITKICSNLKILRIIASDDTSFLDARRWEQLILRYFPDLEKFHLYYHDRIDQHLTYSGRSNQFSSSFWIERQWVLEAEIVGGNIMYSICPYRYIEKSFSYELHYCLSFRKRWYEYSEDKIVHCSKSAKLTLTHLDIKKVIPVNTKHLLTMAQIYHLEISQSKISVDLLIRTIDLFPELMTLKIHSLSCRQSTDLSAKASVILHSIEVKNKISKVYLEKMKNHDELDFLLALCPYMEYLKIKRLNNTDVQLFLRHIKKKIHCNDHLRSLCFRVPAADDHLVQTLQKLIDDEKLWIDYTIKRVFDQIYLQWK
jgi:hypothetical protein